jgi:hypothetical protein
MRNFLLESLFSLFILSACAAAATTTPFACPVTIPNGQTPPLEKDSPTHHGNGSIWTVLPEDGILHVPPYLVNPDGSLDWKAPWWRSPAGAPLTLTGRRLDTDSPPFTATLPPDYMDYVQSVGWHFPGPGCWEITGETADSTLTFVVQVVEAP